MFNFEKINLTLSFNLLFFFTASILLIGYTIYVYKYTIPPISVSKKIFLTSLRILALLLLLFILFEPILTLAQKISVVPKNLIFIDNSRSMRIKDGTKREETEKNFINGLKKNNLVRNAEFYTFGNHINKIQIDSLNHSKFNEGSTNFSQIFSEVKNNEENISSIVIVSDGVITEGTDPLYTAEKLDIPVYTVGTGDTTERNDVQIKTVLYNQYIYNGTPTSIIATVLNKGFAGKKLDVALYESGKQIDKKSIGLASDGVQNVEFTYIPKKSGERKLSLVASHLKGEFTYANNKKVFYINVLSNKIKVLIVAGTPSSDLTFIRNTLLSDTNLTVNSIIQLSQNRFLEKNNKQQLIDSADVIFLIGFPSKATNNTLIRSILNAINLKNKPYFITLSNGIDFNKLREFNNVLGFSFNKMTSNYNEVQPEISSGQSKNPLLRNNTANPIETWNKLPPVLQPDIGLKAKPESNVIAKTKVNNVPLNIPLIITKRIGNQKSIAVLAKNIWRWKLQTAPNNLDLFNRFIISSLKWLNTKNNLKQVTIRTTKKLYSLGEQVEFSAQVYDATFNPVSDAAVQIYIKHRNNNYTVNLNSMGNGLYEGTFQTNKAGDYIFKGEALLNNKKLGSGAGKFNVGEVDIEMINPQMNYEYLTLLSNQTGGKFFNYTNYPELYPVLKEKNKKSAKDKIKVSEINLWSNRWIMIAVIILFGLEWFFRKRAGML